MSRKNTKQSRQDEIKETIMKYAENNVLNISEFRKNNPKMYATIPYYFGTIDSLLNEIWDAAWSKEGVEVENLKATYMKEKTTK